MNKKTAFITRGALIAALYVALTLASSALGLSSGPIQIRLSEMLTVLPALTGAAVPGLFVGCIIANLVTGCLPWDVALGSLATLAGALLTYRFRQRPALAPLFPIAANAAIVPFILQYVYRFEGGYWYFLLTVTIGEAICCGVLGRLFYKLALRTKVFDARK